MKVSSPLGEVCTLAQLSQCQANLVPNFKVTAFFRASLGLCTPNPLHHWGFCILSLSYPPVLMS